MRYSFSTITFFLIILIFSSLHAGAFDPPPQQIVLILSDSWDASGGTLYALERQGTHWQKAMEPWPVVVGKNGMGWGVGQGTGAAGPRKKEGDGKAPAGRFPLGMMMGYAPDAPGGTASPYLQITEETRCVDDIQSPLYNRIVERDGLPAAEVTWTSAEVMRRKDDLYKWLIVTGYNQPDPQPGKGSCIFIHVWRNAEKGTAGCTALAEENLVRLMRWLAPQQAPKLIQMPRNVFRGEPGLEELQKLILTP